MTSEQRQEITKPPSGEHLELMANYKPHKTQHVSAREEHFYFDFIFKKTKLKGPKPSLYYK